MKKWHPTPWKLQEDIDQKRNVKEDTLVGTGRLDMTGLLALVAHALTLGLGRAVTRDVANLAA